MGLEVNVRRAVVGSQPPMRKLGAGIAVVLFVLTGLYALGSHFVYHRQPETVLWLLVFLGVCLSGVFAYWRGGLAVSLLLVFGPVGGPLAFYRWLMWYEGKGPVGLVLSFHGHGAVTFWIPTALLLGTLAFGVGVIARWGTNYLTAQEGPSSQD